MEIRNCTFDFTDSPYDTAIKILNVDKSSLLSRLRCWRFKREFRDKGSCLMKWIIIMGFLFGSTGLFADKRVPKKRKIDTTSPEYKQMLHRIIHNRADSGILKKMAADKELEKYKKYKKQKEKDKMWEDFKGII